MIPEQSSSLEIGDHADETPLPESTDRSSTGEEVTDAPLHPNTLSRRVTLDSVPYCDAQGYGNDDTVVHTYAEGRSADSSAVTPSHQETHHNGDISQDDASVEQSLLSGGESPNDELHSVVPCWDLDHVVEEGPSCPRISVSLGTLGIDVALQVISQAMGLFATFLSNKDPHLLQRAIHLLDHIIPPLSYDILLVGSLWLQATCRHHLFDKTQDTSLLDQCIGACEVILDLQAWGLTDRHTTLVLRGDAFGDRYDRGHDIEDLDRGIGSYQEALEPLEGNAERPASLVMRLGALLLKRHERRKKFGDLNDAIRLFCEALLLLTVDDPERPTCLDNLGTALEARYWRLGDIADAEEAIVHHREALELRDKDHPDRTFCLNNLGSALTTRYQKLGNIADVEEAIIHHREALSLRGADHPNRASALNNLANVLVARYEKLGNISDVEEAIILHREALSLREGDHPDRPSSLNNLANALLARYERFGNIADVEETIIHLHEALSLLPSDHSDRASSLGNLAVALTNRYNRSGDIADIEAAIIHLRGALLLREGGHPDRPTTLNNLANALVARYNRLGDSSNIEETILHLREALSLLTGNHPDRPGTLNNLANALLFRYEKSRSLSSLGEAIRLLEEASTTSHLDTPARSLYVFSLANVLTKQYLMAEDVHDLNEAISLYEETLSLRPNDHPDRPAALQSLAAAFLNRARDASDVEHGMQHFEASLFLFPSHSPQRQTAILNFLSFQENHPTSDWTRLRGWCIELAKLTPEEHPDYSRMTSWVAPILHVCYDTASELVTALGLNPDMNAEDATLALLQKGSRSSASPSIHQLGATCLWIVESEKFGRPCTLEIYSLMLEHLSLAVSRGSSLDVRYQQLSGPGVLLSSKRLLSDGVAVAIQHGAFDTAVEFLERGRSILLSQLMDYRAVSGLETVAPDLARRFEDISWLLETATVTEDKALMGTETARPFEDPISRSDRLRREWEALVEEIRALEGFNDFLQPIPFAGLQKAAVGGPVIFININQVRSDAIIVTSKDRPVIVPLPSATPTHIQYLVSLFQGVAKGHDARNPLRSLWEDIVEPIVSALEMRVDVPKGSRIWWCPADAVMTLPLHAAGDYYSNGKRLPDLYVSSYVSTLGALSRARQSRSERSDVPNILLVGQSRTPKLRPLPSVPEELARVKKRLPHATAIEDEQGTRDAVLSAVVQHQWIHLSCHGDIHPRNPLRSHFALQDGPLSLLDLMQNRLPDAQLAFLSCCHSASGDSAVPDEFLHLTSGMQFAGFKSVVGTLWEMNDAVGPMLADEFYRVLLGRKGKGDYRNSAKALSDALKILRREKIPAQIWINFVHWGA